MKLSRFKIAKIYSFNLINNHNSIYDEIYYKIKLYPKYLLRYI
jgi:hypothetical protein